MKKNPQHLVLYPDGNRRWAKKKGFMSIKGHKQGYENLMDFCQWCRKKGVKIITVFGFSTENWNRPKREIKYLLDLFENYLKSNLNNFQKNNIKVRIIGQKERLPKSLQTTIKKVEDTTKNNKAWILNLAISYGGKWDILQAMKAIVKKGISLRKITEKTIESFLSTANLPEPDIIVRAGGERRFSNFLLWQAAYSEIFFSKKLWPDFSEKDLDEIFDEYADRQRRFGH